MKILIGCAKDMAMHKKATVSFLTEPLFEKEAESNARQMAAYSPEELCDMLGVSPKIAVEVYRRYQSFFDDSSLPEAAIISYNGVVFKNIGVEDFSADDFDYAQRHLRITSFLYGLLRPLDGIRPYRLEGKIELPENGMTMFAYWRSRLTDTFIKSITDDDGIVVDLASAEMRQLFDWNRVERAVTVIKPNFFVEKNGKLSMPSVNAKKCRGAMTSWLIRNRITDPYRLSEFTFNGMTYRGDTRRALDLTPTYL